MDGLSPAAPKAPMRVAESGHPARDGALMHLHILGCAGGIGGRERLTTCLAIDHDVLLDAGTGVGELSVEALTKIDHVFLTHSHLDHVVGLAFLLDAVLGRRRTPVTVHASEAVIGTLKKHLFNWLIWPDFARLPNPAHPVLRWEVLEPRTPVVLGERVFCAYPVDHTVNAVAYVVRNERSGFVFSGDMGSSPELWAALAKEPRINKVLVDCSFPDAEAEIARLSKHYHPRALLADAAVVPDSIEFLVTHLKPGCEALILDELRAGSARQFHALKRGDRFTF